MSLKARLLKTGSIQTGGLLSEAEVYTTRDFAPTPVPMINLALSADVYGGVSAGLTAWCGPSRHFKTLFCLLSAKAYLDKYEDAVVLFYDSEFGSPPAYFSSAGIDPNRVVWVPITTYEQLRSDIAQKLEEIKRGDHVVIVVDSLGNLASSKEATDAINENDKADFTRSKVNKSLFRIVTPHLRLKNIPMHVVQHTYDTMCLDENTIIKTLNGLKPLKNVSINDVVYTINGTQRVTHTYSHEQLNPSEKEYLEITFDDGSSIRCTDNHEFYMIDKTWKHAADFVIGDKLY